MIIAAHRIFANRAALAPVGRFRYFVLLTTGQRVRVLRRLGRGLYVCEPVRWRLWVPTPDDRVRIGHIHMRLP